MNMSKGERAACGLFFLATFPLLYWVDALMLRDLWSYFIHTAFGLKQITVVQALGINLFGAALRFNLSESILLTQEKRRDKDAEFHYYLVRWAGVLFIWGVGAAVYHGFIK